VSTAERKLSFPGRYHADDESSVEARCGCSTNPDTVCHTNGTKDQPGDLSNGMPQDKDTQDVDLIGVGSQFGTINEVVYPQSMSEE